MANRSDMYVGVNEGLIYILYQSIFKVLFATITPISNMEVAKIKR